MSPKTTQYFGFWCVDHFCSWNLNKNRKKSAHILAPMPLLVKCSAKKYILTNMQYLNQTSGLWIAWLTTWQQYYHRKKYSVNSSTHKELQVMHIYIYLFLYKHKIQYFKLKTQNRNKRIVAHSWQNFSFSKRVATSKVGAVWVLILEKHG